MLTLLFQICETSGSAEGYNANTTNPSHYCKPTNHMSLLDEASSNRLSLLSSRNLLLSEQCPRGFRLSFTCEPELTSKTNTYFSVGLLFFPQWNFSLPRFEVQVTVWYVPRSANKRLTKCFAVGLGPFRTSGHSPFLDLWHRPRNPKHSALITLLGTRRYAEPNCKIFRLYGISFTSFLPSFAHRLFGAE